jgi:hypothetical protein
MLGLARHSQLAGWGSGGPPQAQFSSLTSALAYENYQQPSYSILTGYFLNDIAINTTGNYDLTGYSALAGFNNQKSTQMVTLRLTWPTSGIPSGDYVAAAFANEFKLTGGTLYFNPTISLSNSNTTLQVTVGTPGSGVNLTLPGSYSQYVDRWITVIWSASNTQSDYTAWAGTTTGSQHFARTALYDTVTGELLGKQDFRGTYDYPNFATVPNTFPAGSDFGANTQYMQTNCFGSGSEARPYRYRLANWWLAIGTMWDPLTATDTSWRTNRPSRDIGTARAWYNIQMTDYLTRSDPTNYFIKTSGMDLYSQASNHMNQTGMSGSTPQGYDTSTWATVYSDTIYTSTRG